MLHSENPPGNEAFYTSLSGIALVRLALKRFTSLSSALAIMDAPADLIADIYIIRSYCALLARARAIMLPLSSTMPKSNLRDRFIRSREVGVKIIPP